MPMGEQIKKYRQAAKLSQEKVAELVGVSRQAVTKWENGQSAPSTENLFKLAEIFGITVEELIPASREKKESPAEQIYYFYKMEQEQEKAARRARQKRNLRWAALVLLGYLLVYLLGRLLWGNLAQSTVVGWLTGTDSTAYLFGWLIHKKIYWFAMLISVLPALFGKFRFAVTTFVFCVVGIAAGELFGPNPAGAAMGHGHYGWAIWIVLFFLSIGLGIVLELRAKHREKREE